MKKSELLVNLQHLMLFQSHINGREFTVNNVSGNSITINTTGLSFPDDSFTLTETDIFVLSDESESVEAFFEGASDVYEGAEVNFSSETVVIREIGDGNKHAYTNTQMAMTGTHTIPAVSLQQLTLQSQQRQHLALALELLLIYRLTP